MNNQTKFKLLITATEKQPVFYLGKMKDRSADARVVQYYKFKIGESGGNVGHWDKGKFQIFAFM